MSYHVYANRMQDPITARNSIPGIFCILLEWKPLLSQERMPVRVICIKIYNINESRFFDA